jgi:hypothetical protein
MISTRHRVRGVSLAIAATLATGALAGPAMAAEAPGDGGGDPSDIIVVCRKAGKDVPQYLTMRKAGKDAPQYLKLKKSGPPTGGFIILI